MPPPIPWTMAVDGVTTTLAAWGVRDPRIVYRSLDVDEFTFTLAGDIYAAPALSFGQTVQLYRADVPWFYGTVTRVAAVGDDTKSVWEVTVSNAWWQLSRTMFQQEMAAYNSVCVWVGNLRTTKVVLNQHALLGTSITTGQQIRDVITYAASIGIPIAVGTVPEFVAVPFEVARDLTLADVIRRSLQPTPDAVSWCDYSAGGAPIFNAQVRSLLPTTSLDLAEAVPIVADLRLEQRNDLVPAGVRMNYLGVKVCPIRVPPGCIDPATGVVNGGATATTSSQEGQAVTITQDVAGAPDSPGGIIGTVELAQLDEETTETAPVGLAGEYYAALITAPWQGRIVTVERECSGGLRPGKKLNVANGAAAWATMGALIQEVSENLYAGETAATMGPPHHLGPQDWIALVQFTRRRHFIQNAFTKTRAPGTDAAPNCDAAKDPEAKKLEDALAGSGALDPSRIAAGLTGDSGPWQGNDVETCDPPGSTLTLYGPK